MTENTAPLREGRDPFVELCGRAVPEVYAYLLARCGDRLIAEDLTSDALLAAVAAVRRNPSVELTTGWFIVVARRRLIDHWRRDAREQRRRGMLDDDVADVHDDQWGEPLDIDACLAALQRLGPHHRAALTLRYLDGMHVAEVACELGRGLHATEALLQRARRALRHAYEEVQAHA